MSILKTYSSKQPTIRKQVDVFDQLRDTPTEKHLSPAGTDKNNYSVTTPDNVQNEETVWLTKGLAQLNISSNTSIRQVFCYEFSNNLIELTLSWLIS